MEHVHLAIKVNFYDLASPTSFSMTCFLLKNGGIGRPPPRSCRSAGKVECSKGGDESVCDGRAEMLGRNAELTKRPAAASSGLLHRNMHTETDTFTHRRYSVMTRVVIAAENEPNSRLWTQEVQRSSLQQTDRCALSLSFSVPLLSHTRLLYLRGKL